MDAQTLSHLFAATLNPDPNARKRAELDIRQITGQEGFLTALLQIVGNDATDIAVRQACSVYLKNRVQKSYDVTRQSDRVVIATSDKEALKASILPLLVASPSKSISTQLASTLKTLVSHDFPEGWPNLLDIIKNLLASNNPREVIAGCIALLEVIKIYRYRQNSDILTSIVSDTFPRLVSVASQSLSVPFSGASEDVATVLHYIIKIYEASISMQLTKHQQAPESLMPWGRLLFQIANLEIPKEVVPEDEEGKERSEWWKTKKWAYAVLGRLFNKYGNPSQLPSSAKAEYLQFAEHFVVEFAPEIFKVYLRQIELLVSGQIWLSKKCQFHILTFLTECVKPKSTWQLLKPHYLTLVSSFVFPQLSFNSAKQELWETDAVEYVRAAIDEYEDFAAPVSAAATFLYTLASNRTKTTLMPILGFINSVLDSNAPPAQKFGALNMTSALGTFIMRHPQVRSNMEQFLVSHVLPQFSSSHPYMRAAAFEVLGTVEKTTAMSWSNEENLVAVSTGVLNGMEDPELPVRVQAALAMRELITSHKSVQMAVASRIEKIIQDLLKLSDETDLDILNDCMETMVELYHDELSPVATLLTVRLSNSYLRLIRENLALETIDIDNDMAINSITADDDKTAAAMGIAKTMGTIVSSIDSAKDILAQVEEIIIPIVAFTLENKVLTLFDNMLDLTDSLTFNLRRISPNMWTIFELIYKSFKSDAIDFLDEMLPSLDNFISYGADVIANRPDYKAMILDIFTTAMTSDQLGDLDAVNGCKLIESLLLNLRGQVNEALPVIISTAFSRLDKKAIRSLQLANLQVLVNTVLYDPAAALQLMETQQPNGSRFFFDKWFATIRASNGVPRVHDKKLAIMALCALMELPPASIPVSLQEGWADILPAALHVLSDLPRAVEARKALEDALTEEQEDEQSESDILELNDDDDADADVWDETSSYMEMLAEEGARLREKAENNGGDDSDDDSSEAESLDEELGFISPLENVDPYIALKQSLTTFQMRNAIGYQLATTALNVEQQTQLMEIMAIAERNNSENKSS